MEHRRRQNLHPQQNPPSSAPTTTRSQRFGEEEDEDAWWKSDAEEDEEGSMAAKAIRASSGARRDSSLSSAYAAPLHSPHPKPQPPAPGFRSQSQIRNPVDGVRGGWTHDSIGSHGLDKRDHSDSNAAKPSFWSTIARKAKSIIDDEDGAQSQSQIPGSPVSTASPRPKSAFGNQFSSNPFRSPDSSGLTPQKSLDSARLQKGFGAIASSLTTFGGTIGNAFEEGLTIVENRTADIFQEGRKLNARKKFGPPDLSERDMRDANVSKEPQIQTDVKPSMQSDLEIQLKASRDVSMAMAAKTKVLLRELKTVKADLAFAKERCSQLEEENKILRVSLEKGDNPEDDDLIRLQLESLLAEKARLAHENSVYARENRFLREIVEYHQLTMQDVVYLDENSEEVTQVYPVKLASLANLHVIDDPQTPQSPSPKSVDQD